MSIDAALMIQKQGAAIGNRGKKRLPVKEVCYSEYGGKILSDNAVGIEYVETKHGTKLFFHSRCRERMRND